MYKLNLKKIKYLLPFLMLFINTTPVYADLNSSNYSKYDTINLYETCSTYTDCIPICIYSAISSKDGNVDIDTAYIGYHYGQTETFKWEIGALQDEEKLYVFSDATLPRTNIYWGNYSMEEKESWNKAPEIDGGKNGYTKVLDEFYCPSFIAADYDFNTELCFSNEKGTCEKRDNFNDKGPFADDKLYTVRYSFASSMKRVIDDTYNQLSIAGATEKEKVKFLNQIDSKNIKYEEGKSSEENAKSNCEVLQQKFKDEKSQKSYINELVEKTNTWNTSVLNDQLKISAQNNDTVNSQRKISVQNLNEGNLNVYTYDNLSRLLIQSKDKDGNLVKRDIKDSSGTNYYDKLNNIYIDNVNASIKGIVDTCNASTNTHIDFDEESFKEEIKEIYQEHINHSIQIDLESTLSCSSLSGIADLISKAYFIIEIAALVILVIFTALDYAKVILSDGQDEMKKVNKKLLTRLIITVVILLLPALINFVLGIFNIQGFNSEDPLCVEIKNK